MQKLSSRSYVVAEAIGRHEEFNTHGALYARKNERYSMGRLTIEDINMIPSPEIPEYIVYSYTTPIAMVFSDGTVWRNPNKYSVTTSKHQGKLYKLA